MLAAVTRVLAAALVAERPLEVLRAEVERAGESLSPEERAWLLAANPDGLRVTSLLVRKLRFERVLAGDAALARAFEADPEAIVARFRRYEASVPARFEGAAEEARAFHEFEARGV